mmetsp:Transcript_29075/g.59542  ORF Transcript_29075/g.59542 Transcript_29075/m.59542 type:complete len:283 (-) Transcript_29075:272-1120(-)
MGRGVRRGPAPSLPSRCRPATGCRCQGVSENCTSVMARCRMRMMGSYRGVPSTPKRPRGSPRQRTGLTMAKTREATVQASGTLGKASGVMGMATSRARSTMAGSQSMPLRPGAHLQTSCLSVTRLPTGLALGPSRASGRVWPATTRWRSARRTTVTRQSSSCSSTGWYTSSTPTQAVVLWLGSASCCRSRSTSACGGTRILRDLCPRTTARCSPPRSERSCDPLRSSWTGRRRWSWGRSWLPAGPTHTRAAGTAECCGVVWTAPMISSAPMASCAVRSHVPA